MHISQAKQLNQAFSKGSRNLKCDLGVGIARHSTEVFPAVTFCENGKKNEGKYKVLGYVVRTVRVKEDKVYTEAPTILHIWDSVDIVMKIHVLLLFH